MRRSTVPVHDKWQDARRMALGMSAGAMVLGVVMVIRGPVWLVWPVAILAVASLVGVLQPALLEPLYRLVEWVGNGLRRCAARGVLAFLYFCVITPVAIAARVCGTRFVERGPNRSRTTYWKSKTVQARSEYENPY